MYKTPKFILNDFTETDEDIGKLVKRYRKDKHITQQELAEAVGVSRACISKLESKNVCPSFEIMISIATYLCIPPNLFMRSPNNLFEF